MSDTPNEDSVVVVDFKKKNAPDLYSDYEVEQLWSCVNCGTMVFKIWVTGEVECVGCYELVQLRVSEDGFT